MIELALADDHKMVRDGLKAMISQFGGMQVVTEASNGQELLSNLPHFPNLKVALIDVNMPEMNGIETTETLSKRFPDIRVIALSMNKDQGSISKMLKAGAMGYILKDSGADDLELAIQTVMKGETYFSPEVTQVMMSSMVAKKRPQLKGQQGISQDLSDREREILAHIADGLTNNEIGEKLFISPRTVDSHRRNLLQKLGVKNSAALVRYAVENGIVNSSD